MLKCFPIDFVRQILEQTLEYEHIKNHNFYGGKNQVALLSFYEQLKTQEDVDRFVKTYRDLTEQENRMDLILNGVLVSPENPTITNIYSSLIVPMSFTCSFRCNIGNRDDCIITLNNLIDNLKGRKVDVAQLNCVDENGVPYATPFCVGTIGHGDELVIRNGDYIGQVSQITDVATLITNLKNKGLDLEATNPTFFYVKHANKLKVVKQTVSSGVYSYTFVEDDGTSQRIIFPPNHTSFEKYKVSLSFDAIRCDEPRNLNGDEYCTLTFGGSATLVSDGVQLGNDMVKIIIAKIGIKAETPIDFADNNNIYPYWYLEPLEMPSGSNANTQISQLLSNKFKTNTHTDSLDLTLQYTFICDNGNTLLKQLFKYARYGTQGITANDISPNMIFQVSEIWSSWGDVDIVSVKTKIIESIDIENTESDVLTIGISMQIQGDYD
ncbi:MAG: hypothetical protein IJG09_10010 [Methanobrevibacter sp.]|nr:hypothetical protein [Methanobrevibacter sp.]